MKRYARLYKPDISVWWWLERRSYTAFVLRELSSVFVAWFVVYLLLLVRAVRQGSAEYQAFLDWSANPWIVGLNVLSTIFVLYHAVTFINLTPQATANRVPRSALYLIWAIASALIAWLVLA
jgi:succinate dehydrogenase subunit C